MKQFNLEGYSVQTDSDEQSRELQEMAFEQGFKWFRGDVESINVDCRFFMFIDKSITWGYTHADDLKQIHFNDIKEHLKGETLKEKLSKAEAEVERLKKEIEEQKIPKAGEWCKFWDGDKDLFIISILKGIYEDNVPYKCANDIWYKNCEKITNPQLIELLNKEL